MARTGITALVITFCLSTVTNAAKLHPLVKPGFSEPIVRYYIPSPQDFLSHEGNSFVVRGWTFLYENQTYKMISGQMEYNCSSWEEVNSYWEEIVVFPRDVAP